MSIVCRALMSVQNAVGCFREGSGYALKSVWALFRPKARLAARLLAAGSQQAFYISGQTPIPQQESEEITGPSKLLSIPILGGLHHRYVRVAA